MHAGEYIISSKIRSLIGNPRLLFKYLLRERNIAQFLNLEQNVVREYLKEAELVTKKMCQMSQGDELGAMFSPLRGPIVYACVRALQPAIMVETGVASGSSAGYILNAMKLNDKGFLYSIDQPNADPGALVPENREVGWLVPVECRNNWKLILGRSQERLALLLRDLGKVDIFLHDSEHTYENMMFEFTTVWPYLKGNGLLLSDDVHWNKAFFDFIENSEQKRWITFDGLGAILATN